MVNGSKKMSCTAEVGIFVREEEEIPRRSPCFEFSGSRERDCLVPIGDVVTGKDVNQVVTVTGKDVNQVVTGKGWNIRGADQGDWDNGRRERK